MALPVNISLMNVDAFIDQHQCKQVTSLFIRESSSDEFHHDGLFSEDIFGQIGSSERLITFGYIDLRTTIIQPLIYGYLIRIKGLYGEIMASKTYAVFDKKEMDFKVAGADEPGAGTGYKFFIDRFNDIKLKKTESASQNDKVAVIEKYRKSCLIDKFLVLPAGLRDMKVDEGKPASDSINKLYSSLMNYCQAMPMNTQAANSDVFDSVRFSIQKKANEIYEFLFDMMEGKFGYFQRKYSSRNLALGTRNVITPADMSGSSPDDPAYLKCDEVKVPVFQAAKMFQPLVVHWIKYQTTKIISQFADQVTLINPDTFKLEYQSITEDEKNLFTTSEGIEKLISLFRDKEFRFNPVYVKTENDKKFYMSLIYDDGDEVYSLRDVEAFRQSYSGTKMFNPAKLRPMTYAELIYMSVYLATVDKFAYVTRYPAIEIGSTVPCKVHIGTTSPSRKVKLINTAFEETIHITLPEYPVIGASFVDSTILHPSILKGLGADFDGNCLTGDTTTVIRYSDEWLSKLNQCDYTWSCQNPAEIIDVIKSKTFRTDNNFHYAEIRLDEMPCPGDFRLDKNSARVYSIPDGCSVMSYDSTVANVVYAPIEHITVEESCDTACVTLRSKKMTVSTNESIAAFDYETGGIKRIKPSECIGDTLIPVVLERPIPLKHDAIFSRGWLHGAMLSDGWVSDKYIGYTKMDPNTRESVRSLLISQLGTGHMHDVVVSSEESELNSNKLGPSYSIRFGGKDAVAFGKTLNMYGSDTPSALTKQIDISWLNNQPEEYLYGLFCGLIDGDGGFRFSEKPLKYDIRYSTSSPKLVDGISRLAYLLGIRISITVTEKRNWSNRAYTICFSQCDLYTKIDKLQFVRPGNRNALERLKHQQSIYFRDQRDIIPIAKNEMKQLVIAAKKLDKLPYFASNNRIMRSDAIKFLSELNPESSLYKRIINTNVHWEPVRSVTPTGYQKVYDLEIPSTKVFVVNDGIVVYDTVSVNGIISVEANEEVRKHLLSKERFIHANGELFASKTDLINLTIFNLSRDPVN